MANTYNYAESYAPEILAVTNQQALTSPFITNDVVWDGAKTIHFTSLVPSGFKAHDRAGGWNRGTIAEADHTFTIDHDRDIEFLVDKADVDETNMTASIVNISKNFQAIRQAPEVDARFFEKVSAAAIAADAAGTATYVDVEAAITAATVVSVIKTAINHVKIYRGSLMVFVNSTIMNLLETAMVDNGRIQWTSVAEGPKAIETRIYLMDGIPVVEVIDSDRFGTAFTYTDGYVLAAEDRGLQICVASLETVKTAMKINSIYAFAPGEHTEGDAYLYQNRQLWDTFVKPNGKNGLIDSVAIVVDTAA